MTPEFDHYTISRVLGEGGMGLVYLAHDRRTSLPVAIKVMSGQAMDAELAARFLKENRILSGLNHRNIVRCYEITESREGVVSIVMEYVDGVDFRAFEGRPYPELLPLMAQALMGLTYLRSRDVLHRDLSSNNIFVTLENDTRVTKILDFGVAKILHQQAVEGDVRTRTGQFLGKFAFASPEHFSGSAVDWRSDVYSLGVIFHRLLTKSPPITVARKGNYFDWLTAHQRERYYEVLAPAGAPQLPEPLRDVVRAMLARRPDDRPQSYDAILEVVDRVQRDLPPELEPHAEMLATLPPPVEGRIGSSDNGATPSPSAGPPAAGRWDSPAATGGAPTAEETSQQKRWPDLEISGGHTERFIASPSRAIPGRPEPPPPPPSEPEPDPAAATGPSSTELLPSAPLRSVTATGPTLVSEPPRVRPETPAPSGGFGTDASGGTGTVVPPPREEATERFDDVIEKLRQHSSLELLPPLKSRLEPVELPAPTLPPTVSAAPPARRTEPPPPAPAPPAPPPAAKPARRVVVYGAPPAGAAAPARAAAPSAPPPVAPAPALASSGGRRLGIAAIVAIIVVVFAAILWILISVLRGAASPETRRSSLARPAASGACRPAVPSPRVT